MSRRSVGVCGSVCDCQILFMPHQFEKEFITPADFLFESVQSLLMGKQDSGSSQKTEADRVVRDWPQKRSL
jgi:hypothetical protein